MFGHHSAANELLKVFEWGIMISFTFKKINLAAVQRGVLEKKKLEVGDKLVNCFVSRGNKGLN